ncbi:hypothetical protein N0V94_000552 [Neodidymelliopsis sp. IMI 364377]|nr:hypothetical protein N0V94_000552 [Neodidymelliopsis sp. IMI 364377]
MALLYPKSTKLQSYIYEYFISVVHLCRHLYKFGQKSGIQQFTASLKDSDLATYQNELQAWATQIQQEVDLTEAQESSGFRAVSRKMFRSATFQQMFANNMRVLDACSTYDHRTTWKQTRKIGNTTCFLENPEYKDWKASATSCTLAYTGKLGSGKSVVLANMVGDLYLSNEKTNFVKAYFFCKHDIPESLKASTILGSLARQLLYEIPDLTTFPATREDNALFTGDTESVLELVTQAASLIPKSYFVLDGLDECEEKEKEMVIQGLGKLQKTIPLLLCISLRIGPNSELQSLTSHLAPTRAISIPVNNPDIEAFIEADLERCLDQKRLVIGDPTLILDIQDALLKGAQGMFLWAALQIQSLCHMKTDQAIREALADLPLGLSETFARILRQSGDTDQLLQLKTMQLVLAACRPLTTNELREALSVTPGDANWDPAKLLNDVYSALSCCGCLLVVDEEESTVRVVHPSVKQYIHYGLSSQKYAKSSVEGGLRMMADIIVTYLGYGVFGTELSRGKVRPVMAQAAPSRVMHATMGTSSTTVKIAMKLLKSRKQPEFDMSKTLAEARASRKVEPVHEFSFYAYATSYWQNYILYVSEQDAMKKLSVKLLSGPMSELGRVNRDSLVQYEKSEGLKNEAIIEALLATGKVNPDAKIRGGRTLTMWAAMEGRYDIVLRLLQAGKIDVNAKDDGGETLLMMVIDKTYVVKSLLDTGKVDVDATDNYGGTAFMQAVAVGNLGTVELLIRTGKVDVDAKSDNGWTPLIEAAHYGHKEITELLLATGKVDLNAKTKEGWTPYICAVHGGHEDIALLLRPS